MSRAKDIIVAFEESLFRSRAKRLSRGNIRLQRDLFETTSTWTKKKQQHTEKIKRVAHRLYPEKY